MAVPLLKRLTQRLFHKNGKALKPAAAPSTSSSTIESVKRSSSKPRTAARASARRTTNKKVLMFGWELPPFNSGGLGVACYDLAKAMADQGADITFVLPKKMDVKAPFMKVVYADDTTVTEEEMRTTYNAYRSSGESRFKFKLPHSNVVLHADQGQLIDEVRKYAIRAQRIAQRENFDVIHSHDWLCYPAGMVAKSVSHKPLVSHVHATEFDRGGGQGVNQPVYEIEKAGLQASDRVIAVSNFTKNLLMKHYGLADSVISVVHNGVNAEFIPTITSNLESLKRMGKKIVLYVGRITLQKGPDYFLYAAKRALSVDQNLVFIMSGAGDMEKQMMLTAASLGISDKVIFTGFLRGRELSAIYQAADVFVMPSISEPFGISTLEAMINKAPAIVSRQSGVAEVLTHALKVDFWDIDEMANKIISVTRHNSLKDTLGEYGAWEAIQHNWGEAATKCIGVYDQVS